MKYNGFKNWNEANIAIVLTIVVIGLLFVLKHQECKKEQFYYKTDNFKKKRITFIE